MDALCLILLLSSIGFKASSTPSQSSSLGGSFKPYMTIFVSAWVPSALSIQCPWWTQEGHRKVTVSCVGSSSRDLQNLFLTKTCDKKGGVFFSLSTCFCRIFSLMKRAATGQRSNGASAPWRVRLMAVLMCWTMASQRPFTWGWSPGVIAWRIVRDRHHFSREFDLNSALLSLCNWITLCPSAKFPSIPAFERLGHRFTWNFKMPQCRSGCAGRSTYPSFHPSI